MTDKYSYISLFPLTIMNIVWSVMSFLLLMIYLTNVYIQPNSSNRFAKAARYFVIYGKTQSVSHSFDIPKRFFTHYYVFASVWNTSCSVLLLGISFNAFAFNWLADIFLLKKTENKIGDKLSIVIVLTLLTIHTYKRLYECLMISVFSSKGKINLVQYAWGFLYYFMLPPTLIAEQLPLEDVEFGTLQIHHVLGIIGFCFASFVHHQSHLIFADLRKKGQIKQDSHGIPVGGMFSLVSCPHYFAEILIYFCFAIILNNQCKSWWLVLFYNFIAHANMGKNAHIWYKKKFPMYPLERKVFIPYIY